MISHVSRDPPSTTRRISGFKDRSGTDSCGATSSVLGAKGYWALRVAVWTAKCLRHHGLMIA